MFWYTVEVSSDPPINNMTRRGPPSEWTAVLSPLDVSSFQPQD